MADQTEAEAIIDSIERLSEHKLIGGESEGNRPLQLAVLSANKRIEDLLPYYEKLLDAPRSIKAAAVVTTVNSFVDYVNRFKIADSAIFLKDDPARPKLVGVIDFHGGTVSEDDDTLSDATPGSSARPRFGQLTVSYSFPMSEQFNAWSAIYGKPLSHEEMATFLNDHQYDVANPPLDWMAVEPETVKLILHLINIGDDAGEIDDAAADHEPVDHDDDRYIPRSAIHKLRKIRFGSAHRLIQMARSVEISANAKATAGYNPTTGERTVSFTEEHETQSQGRRVVVPEYFLLNIPVFESETSQLLPVRLQYRAGASVKWFMTLVDWRRAVRFAIRTEGHRVHEKTALPLFYGSRQASD